MLESLLTEIRQCTVCEPHLPLGANPVIRAHPAAKILIIGQAPGTKVHQTSIPWNDASGERLRQWLGLDREAFYCEENIAIMPMGLCYPAKGAAEIYRHVKSVRHCGMPKCWNNCPIGNSLS